MHMRAGRALVPVM